MRYHSHRTRGFKRITGRLTFNRPSASRGGGVLVHEAEASPTQVQEKLQMTFMQALRCQRIDLQTDSDRGVALRVPDRASQDDRCSPRRKGNCCF